MYYTSYSNKNGNMWFSYYKVLSSGDRNRAFACFFATDGFAWNKPLLRRKFGNAPVFKLSLTVKGSIDLSEQEIVPGAVGLLSFSLLPRVETGMREEHPDPAYICLFKPRFVPPGFRQKLQSLIAVAHTKSFDLVISEKDYHSGAQLFLKILNEQSSGYLYKHELIRTYLSQIIHLALKIKKE